MTHRFSVTLSFAPKCSSDRSIEDHILLYIIYYRSYIIIYYILQIIYYYYILYIHICLTPSIMYSAKVTTTEDPMGKNYIGLTEGPLKQRYTQHALSFRNRHYANSTELSRYIWHLKDNKTDFEIKLSILTSAAAYSNKSKRCNLCLAETFFIIKAEKSTLPKKRSEPVFKCRHEKSFI